MNFLINLVFGLFVLSTICYWISLTMRINSNIFPFLTTGTTIAANMLLFVFLGYRWIKEGYFPLSNLYESLLFLTWCLTSVQLISEAKTSSKIILILVWGSPREKQACFDPLTALRPLGVGGGHAPMPPPWAQNNGPG